MGTLTMFRDVDVGPGLCAGIAVRPCPGLSDFALTWPLVQCSTLGSVDVTAQARQSRQTWGVVALCKAPIMLIRPDRAGKPRVCPAAQAYKYIQRPALPLEQTEAGMEAQAAAAQGRSRVVSGHPIGANGRARPSLFPPFPQVCWRPREGMQGACADTGLAHS